MTALGTATLAVKIALELDLDALRAYGESLIKVADSLAESRALLAGAAKPPRFELYRLAGRWWVVADIERGVEALAGHVSAAEAIAGELLAGRTRSTQPVGYYGSAADPVDDKTRVLLRAFDLPEATS